VKILSIFTLVSLSETRLVIKWNHSSNYNCPEPSASRSAIIWKICVLLLSNPSEVMAALSSLRSTEPP